MSLWLTEIVLSICCRCNMPWMTLFEKRFTAIIAAIQMAIKLSHLSRWKSRKHLNYNIFRDCWPSKSYFFSNCHCDSMMMIFNCFFSLSGNYFDRFWVLLLPNFADIVILHITLYRLEWLWHILDTISNFDLVYFLRKPWESITTYGSSCIN